MPRNTAIVLVIAVVVLAGAAVSIYYEKHRNIVEIGTDSGGVKVQGPSN